MVAFDLDDTLAASKQPLDASMALALVSLLRRLPVCIITGGQFSQLQTQVLDRLHAPQDLLAQLHLMPTCGTRYYTHRGHVWQQQYAENLSPQESRQIRDALETAARSLGLWAPGAWGDLIEDRGSQVTYSALGQDAPVAAKTAWDPDGQRREALVARASTLLPGLEVRAGGSTSIDVTRSGIDKAYGVRKLMARLHATTHEVLFVGDRLDQEGNDYPVLAMGIPCAPVRNWHETVTVIGQFEQWWDGDVERPPFVVVTT